MRFQTTLEGTISIVCQTHDAGWQSVPDTRRSDEERAVSQQSSYDTKMV